MNFRKIAAFSIGPLASAAISLISIPILAWIYAAEDIGRYAMLQVAINFALLFFTVGLDQAFVREYHEAPNRPSLLKTTALTGLTLLATTSLIQATAPELLSNFLFGLSGWPIGLLVQTTLLLAFLNRFLSLILRMQERGIAFSLSQVLSKAAFLAIILFYWITESRPDFGTLIAAHCISLAGVTIFLAWTTRRECAAAFSADYDVALLRALFKYSMPLTLSSLAFWVLISVDKIFIREFSTFENLAIYSVSANFAAAAVILQSIFSTIWAPTVYKWTAENSNLEKIDLATQLTTVLVIIIFSIAGLFSWTLTLLVPPEYSQIQFLIPACMAYPLLYTLSEATFIGLGVTRKSGYTMTAAILAATANCLANYFLVPPFGAAGAASATALAFWLFFVLRTEFSSRVWRPIPRLSIYTFSTIVTLLCILMALGSTRTQIITSTLWLFVGSASIFVYRNQISLLINIVLAKRRAARTL